MNNSAIWNFGYFGVQVSVGFSTLQFRCPWVQVFEIIRELEYFEITHELGYFGVQIPRNSVTSKLAYLAI